MKITKLVKESLYGFDGAYMVRSDGQEFKVPFHPYLYDEFDIIDWSEFLYNSIKSQDIKDKIINIIYTISKKSKFSITKTIEEYSVSVPKSADWGSKVQSMTPTNTNVDVSKETEDISDYVNENFLRVRVGGKYDRSSAKNSAYFRVSSRHTDWFDIIYNFVYKHSEVSDVTICHDEETIGDEKIYRHGRDEFNHMTKQEFLSVSGNPDIS